MPYKSFKKSYHGASYLLIKTLEGGLANLAKKLVDLTRDDPVAKLYLPIAKRVTSILKMKGHG